MLDATERKTLAASAFVAGCLLAGPKQFVAAGTSWVLAALLFAWHLLLARKESFLLVRRTAFLYLLRRRYESLSAQKAAEDRPAEDARSGHEGG